MTLLLSVTFVNAQVKNKTIETVKINGNCGMCKKLSKLLQTLIKLLK